MHRLVPLAIVLLAIPMNTHGAEEGDSSGKKTLLAGAVTSNVTPQLGLPVIKKTKTSRSTDSYVLEKLAKDYDIAQYLLNI